MLDHFEPVLAHLDVWGKQIRIRFACRNLEHAQTFMVRRLSCTVVPFCILLSDFGCERSGQPQVVQPRSFLGCHHCSSLPRSHWKFCQAIPRIPDTNIRKSSQISFLKDPETLWLLQRKLKAMDSRTFIQATLQASKSTGPKWSCLRHWVKDFPCAKGLGVYRRIRLTMPAVVREDVKVS